MSSLRLPKLWTADDLWAMPEECRYELIEGKMREITPPPGWEHGYRTMELSSRATIYVSDHDLGVCFAAETGFLIRCRRNTRLSFPIAYWKHARHQIGLPRWRTKCGSG